MKRFVLALVAFLALLMCTAQPAQADWVVDITSDGWAVLRWDPGFDDGTSTPIPPPPTPWIITLWLNGYWFAFM